jgi:hypothetical protein
LHELVGQFRHGHDGLETVLDVHVFELLDVVGLQAADLREELMVGREQRRRGRHDIAALRVQEFERAVDEVAEVVE